MLNLHVNPCCSFFILYSFYVAPFIVLYFFTLHLYSFHVVLSSCYTLFVLHFLRVELFHVALFRCCTFFHVTDLSGYPVPIFSYYIFFILYSFHVALFSVLHSFHIAPSFVMHCSNFFVFFFFLCVLFHVTPHLNFAVLSSCTFLMFYLFIYYFSYWSLFEPKLFLCCAHVTPFFVVHCFHLLPILLSFHVAPFLCWLLYISHLFYFVYILL